MNQAQGESAVITSAVIVAGIYGYRKLIEPSTETKSEKGSRSAKQVAEGVIGTGELLPVGPWVTGFGVTYIVLSILVQVSPTAGGYGAILVALGCGYGNIQGVHKDLKKALGNEKEKTSSKQKENKTPEKNASDETAEPAETNKRVIA